MSEIRLYCINDNCNGSITIKEMYEDESLVKCSLCNQIYEYKYEEGSDYEAWPCLYPIN